MIKNDTFILGKKVALRALNESDVESTNWYGWFNDKETTAHMQKHYFPNTKKDQLRFLKSILDDKSKLQLGIVDIESDCLVGIVSLNNINHINRNAEFSIVIGEKKYRNLVFAEETVSLILDHAFNSLNVYKVYGGAVETLKPWVIFLQKRFGFEIEGFRKNHVFKNGKYLDLINFYITSEMYNHKKEKK